MRPTPARIGFEPDSDELTIAPLSARPGPSTRPALGTKVPTLPEARTEPISASIQAPFSPFPSGGNWTAPPPSTNRPQTGPWGSPSVQPGFETPPSADPFVAAPTPTIGTHPTDLGKPNPMRFVAWGLGAIVLAILAGVIVAMLAPSGPIPQIEIVSTPSGAAVSLDGVSAGTTPLTLSEGLEVGRSYSVELTLPEHQVWRASIQAQPGLVQQSATLSPFPATLHVDTIPQGALILVGGAPRGPAPVDVSGFFVGQSVEVRASLPGHGPPIIQVVPIATATTRVTVSVP